MLVVESWDVEVVATVAGTVVPSSVIVVVCVEGNIVVASVVGVVVASVVGIAVVKVYHIHTVVTRVLLSVVAIIYS